MRNITIALVTTLALASAALAQQPTSQQPPSSQPPSSTPSAQPPSPSQQPSSPSTAARQVAMGQMVRVDTKDKTFTIRQASTMNRTSSPSTQSDRSSKTHPP